MHRGAAARSGWTWAAGITTVTLTLLGWSSIPLFLKHFTHLIDAWTANGWRYTIAAGLWAPAIVLALRRGELDRRLWRAALVPSVFNVAGQACFALAPYYVDPGLMTFALRVHVVFVTAGAAWLFAAERCVVRTPAFLVGLVLVVAGTSGTVAFQENGPGRGTAVGVGLAIASGALYAGYALAVRHYMQNVKAVTAFAVISQYTAAGLLVPMFVLGEQGGARVLELPSTEVGLLVLSAIVGIGLGHTFYYMSISRLGVAVSSGVIQLQPVLVAMASATLFDERLTTWQWLSGLAAVSGAGAILAAQQRSAGAEGAGPPDEKGVGPVPIATHPVPKPVSPAVPPNR